MPTPDDAHFDAAQRLLEQELATGGDHDTAAAAGRLYQRLHDVLAPVIGAVAVRAIFTRSARLAVAELSVPGTGAVTTDLGPGLVDALRRLPPDEQTRMAIRLFANFLRLLTSFIGDALTSRIVQGAFPKLVGSGTGSD